MDPILSVSELDSNKEVTCTHRIVVDLEEFIGLHYPRVDYTVFTKSAYRLHIGSNCMVICDKDYILKLKEAIDSFVKDNLEDR